MAPDKRSKQVWRTEFSNSIRPVHVPHRPEHENMSPAPKYANTGRMAKSFHGPTVMAHLQSLQSQVNALRNTIHRKPRVTRPSRSGPTTSTRCYQRNVTQSEGDKDHLSATEGDDRIDSRLNVSKSPAPVHVRDIDQIRIHIKDKQINRRQSFCRQP